MANKVLYNGKTLCLGEDAVLTSETIIDGGVYVFAPTFDFTVHGVKYSAEEGFTWRRFIDSGYNTDGFKYDDQSVVTTADGEIIVDPDGNAVDADHAIVDGCAYVYQSEYVAPTINFTVDGTTYTAERGSTWAAFIASARNEDGIFAVGDEATDLTQINFTIDDVSYSAYKGMTWQKWLTSTYNTGNFYAYDGGVYVDKDGTTCLITGVALTDVINANSTYGTEQY